MHDAYLRIYTHMFTQAMHLEMECSLGRRALAVVLGVVAVVDEVTGQLFFLIALASLIVAADVTSQSDLSIKMDGVG